METFVKRLFEFMSAMGMSQNKFEETCGLTHTDLRKKKQGPTAEYLMRIIAAYPQLSLDWLFRGTGNMFLEELSQQASSPSVSIGTIQTVNIGNWDKLVEILKPMIK